MGDLGSSTKSGTPLETRQGTERAGVTLADLFGEGQDFGQVISSIGSPFQRLGTMAQQNLLGFDPRVLGLGETAQNLLSDPSEITSELFAEQQPFLEESLERDVAGLRSGFGQAGGRFSRNLMREEGRLRGDRRSQIRQDRLQTQLGVRQQQGTDLARMLTALNQSQQIAGNQGIQGLSQILGFLQPGGPIVQQGILPGLLQAGAMLGSTALMPDPFRNEDTDLDTRRRTSPEGRQLNPARGILS